MHLARKQLKTPLIMTSCYKINSFCSSHQTLFYPHELWRYCEQQFECIIYQTRIVKQPSVCFTSYETI